MNSTHFLDCYASNFRCWISEEKGAIWAFIGPMLLIILVCGENVILNVMCIYPITDKHLLFNCNSLSCLCKQKGYKH